MSLTAALTALSPNVAVYSALRFSCGFARSNVGTIAFVLSSELVPRRQRNNVSIITTILSTAGFLSLPVISYLNRANSWRLLYLYTSIPSLFYSIFLYFFMEDSPRWLLIKGKRKEAIETLKKLSTSKKTESFPDLALRYTFKTESEDFYYAARMLWEKRWAFRRLLAIITAGFGVGMMYYGMPLNLGNLDANLYISVALTAVDELLAALTLFFIGDVVSRRRFIMGLMAVSGGSSLVCTVTDGWLAVVAELFAFFAALAVFCMLVTYTTELFPTSVRSTAVTVVRQAVVLGGVAAPTLVAAGRRRKFLSFGVFGIVIIFCGFFIVFLPETSGRGISDTMEEEEEEEKEEEERH